MPQTREIEMNVEGNKSIKLAIYFFTDVGKDGEAMGVSMPKKSCWDAGIVTAVSNNRHGIRSGTKSHFNCMEELPKAIQDAIKKSEITVYPVKMAKQLKEAWSIQDKAKLT